MWVVAAALFIRWGLPTSQYDPLLFGGDAPWPPERYPALRQSHELAQRSAGADTDLNPLTDATRLADLTGSPEARGEILQRYRLYSRQPDEMITFRALQRMRPSEGDLDPRLYQYGGAYIYLVAAALALSHAIGFVQVTGDAAVYLSTPERFGLFYVVARAVSLGFSLFLLVGVARLARRAGGETAGWAALLCAAAAPIVLCGALEAKPHLPSACLLIWATHSALDYQRRGRPWDAVRMGVQVGLAFGLVLTGAAGALLWPVLLLAARAPLRRRVLDLGLAGVAALAVYAATNPYILYNAVFNPDALSSNLGNSTAMYRVGRLWEGARRVCELMFESGGAGLVIGGTVAWLLFIRERAGRALTAGAAGVGLVLIAVLIGAGKPAEFARFLLLPTVLLAAAVGVVFARVWREYRKAAATIMVVIFAMMPTYAYVRSFYRDVRLGDESRYSAGRFLAQQLAPGDAVGVLQEPAPYSVPPLDFARRRVLLLPRNAPPGEALAEQLPEWLVFTADEDAPRDAWWRPHFRLARCFPDASERLSPITWANKATFVYAREPSGASR